MLSKPRDNIPLPFLQQSLAQVLVRTEEEPILRRDQRGATARLAERETALEKLKRDSGMVLFCGSKE